MRIVRFVSFWRSAETCARDLAEMIQERFAVDYFPKRSTIVINLLTNPSQRFGQRIPDSTRKKRLAGPHLEVNGPFFLFRPAWDDRTEMRFIRRFVFRKSDIAINPLHI